MRLPRAEALRRSAPAGSFLRRRRARRSCELPDDRRLCRSARNDGAHPDADVEDATQLVLLDSLLREPPEDRGTFPGSPVDARLERFRQDAREVPEDPAAGDMRERSDLRAALKVADLVDVETVGGQEKVGVEVAVADDVPDE